MNHKPLHKSKIASAVLLLLFKRRTRISVLGRSMHPNLQHGDELLVNPHAYKRRSPQVGDIVIARDPRTQQPIIKRVATHNQQGDCYLLGDNPTESTDSRVYGMVSAEDILGKVTAFF